MSEKKQQPRRRGSRAARAGLVPAVLAALLGATAPLGAQALSRFSPRLPSDGTDTPGGPSLGIYTGVARGYDDHVGTAFNVQLELGRVGPARGLLGIVAGKVVGSVEGGLLVQPERESATSPYVAVTWFTHGLEDDDAGIAFHVGAEVRHTRELGLRLEGRAYLADQAALVALIGLAFR